MNTTDTNTSTRTAKRTSYAKKVQGSFRVKSNKESNVVVNVTKTKTNEFDYETFMDSKELVRMNDMDIIIRNILCFGEDVIWGENIKIWEVETIIAICDEIHEIDVYVTYTKLNEDSAYVRFGAKLND